MTKANPSTERNRSPKNGTEIVWRFKDNKGWRVGFVRGVLAKGRIVEISEGRYSSWGIDTVSIDDIDWYLK